jgi:uncharacterized protein YbjT (DUF2867 family)
MGQGTMTVCKMVVLGGYGHFGARTVRALAPTPTPTLQVMVAGRHPAAAAANLVGAELGDVAVCRLDTAAADFPAQLAATGADIVVHTAGPFQDPHYAVAHACLQAGMQGPVNAIGIGHVAMCGPQVVARGAASGWPPGCRTRQPEGPRLGAHGTASSLGRLLT